MRKASCCNTSPAKLAFKTRAGCMLTHRVNQTWWTHFWVFQTMYNLYLSPLSILPSGSHFFSNFGRTCCINTWFPCFFYRWSVSNLQRHIQICGGFVATEAPNLGKILVQNLNLQQDFTKISQPAAGFCKNFPANISDKAKTRYSRMPCATVCV